MAPFGKRCVLPLLTGVLAVIVSEQTASAQLVGTDICACQPSVYKLKLDFSLACTDTTVAGPGINNTACNVNSRNQNENVTNPFPISVSEVQVLELGQNLEILGSSIYSGTYFDGDEISYTSVTLSEPEKINAESIPRGFQVFITGVNSDEEPLVNQMIITYTNDCGIFPLLEVGDLIGWVNFADLGKPAEEFCPIAGPDTQAPVSPPTKSPVVAPFANSTEAPVAAPVEPLANSTETPVAAPVETPVIPPSCPPFEAYEESTPRDIKGGSSQSGIRDIKGGMGEVPSSKAGKVPRSGKSKTESAESGSSKTRRWLATGSHCPEPSDGNDDSGDAVPSKGSVPKGGSNKDGKYRSSESGSTKSKSKGSVDSIPAHEMSRNETESESMPSKKTEMRGRRLRQ